VRTLLAAAAACLVWLGAMGAASAQGYGSQPGRFDFYVLALSWSPGFCALEGDRKGRSQCETGAGLGFVVHGLWPQYERGFPSECGAERNPTSMAMNEARDVFPDPGLARHQWRKHGTCSGLSPTDYFRAVRQAREQVTIPEKLIRPTTDLTAQPIVIERAFAEVNPGLRPDMMSVSCRRGVLQEVRICFDRTLRGFRTCPEVDRSGCRGGSVLIEAVR
jgi:ribonuclease T2